MTLKVSVFIARRDGGIDRLKQPQETCKVMTIARTCARLLLAGFAMTMPCAAFAQAEPVGIVIMHGKSGNPNRFVSDLARAMERKGYLVANIEMPWSGRLNFGVPIEKAEQAVTAAAADLRARGAKKIFIAGHSLGGNYTLYLAGRLTVDGVIPIAPGGSIGNPGFRNTLGGTIARARQLVAEGKGNDRTQLEDYEGGKGTYLIDTIPAHWLAWHEVEGPMNMDRSARAVNAKLPVLFIIPKRDYPNLLKSSPALFHALPPHPLTRLYEPDSDHLNSPGASADEIARWMREVADASK